MRTLDELVNSLKLSRSIQIPELLQFPGVDLERIATEVGLESRAKENGLRGMPVPEETSQDGVELDIKAAIEKIAAETHASYSEQLQIYGTRIQELRAPQQTNLRISAECDAVVASFARIGESYRDRMARQAARLSAREEELQEFQRKHNLGRLPAFPSRRERNWKVAVLVFLVVIETVMNGFFFATSSREGLLGGISQAFVLSLLNVGLAWFAGKFVWPLTQFSNVAVRGFGYFFTILLGLGTLALNVTIAHIRDLFESSGGASVSSREALRRMWSAPFDLESVDSFVLLCLGCLAALIAAWESFKMDDPFPGFGALGRLLEGSQEDYDCLKDDFYDEIGSAHNLASLEFKSLANNLEERAKQLARAEAGQQNLYRNFCATLDRLRGDYLRLVRRYRDANMRARPVGTSAPRVFEVNPSTPALLEAPAAPVGVPEAGPSPSDLQHLAVEGLAKIRDKFEYVCGQIAGSRSDSGKRDAL